jgi:glycine dehydrogenase
MQNTSNHDGFSGKISLSDHHVFSMRHIGPDEKEQEEILKALDVNSLDQLILETVPESIRIQKAIEVETIDDETEVLKVLKTIASKNKVHRSMIGMGFYDTITPAVIQRNIFENPGWYTQYTPYQAEIAQGRLEALLNFQTLTSDLTGLPVANASLLDEATACAEAMTMSKAGSDRNVFYVSNRLHPQNIAVIQTRAKPLKIELSFFSDDEYAPNEDMFGVIFQYPDTLGVVDSEIELKIAAAKSKGLLVTLVADPLSLMVLKSPGSVGADIAVGSFQRFGVPMGFGGPSAAYMSCKEEFKRTLPGRIVGLSKDVRGKPAIRLALQTREQHIRREKATSNICTSQVLLAVMASMYAVYHGPKGLSQIAKKIHGFAKLFKDELLSLGFEVEKGGIFDTVTVDVKTVSLASSIVSVLENKKINIRRINETKLSVAFDEAVTLAELNTLIEAFSEGKITSVTQKAKEGVTHGIPQNLLRTDSILKHPVFNRYHSEHEMLRYMASLERKDLSLNFSMIPLGSCTMKLNASTEMMPVTWPEFGKMHPAAPRNQIGGYLEFFDDLEKMLAEVTGFDAISLQPNAGSQGEYAGLLAIRSYHEARGDTHRDVCLIPKSAHGTNPASATMAGFKVVVVECDRDGNVDVADLLKQAEAHKKDLAALMVTYPSTHGVFETQIKEICEIVHNHGGQVYMDGANMNAQIGLCRPGDFGPDVCHLNLHKTFCIPHGGGGPGMGPIGVKKHLAEFLPNHVLQKMGGENSCGAVSAAPWGSASILTISWVYMKLMGSEGLKKATQVAIMNGNYIAKKLENHYPVLYKGFSGRVAHECILDLRPLKAETGVEVEDIAKRLMDYGFHAPTISFPVTGTLMIEPTESESKAEMDRFIQAMISIREEIEEIKLKKADPKNNVLKNAPHTAEVATSTEWMYPYSREKAIYPLAFVKDKKFWPSVSRIDNVYGDRNLICTCPPIEDFQ